MGSPDSTAWEFPEPRSVIVRPTHDDAMVRGLSQAVGGPRGEHAAGPRHPPFWSPARLAVLLGAVMMLLAWWEKSPCQNGAWVNNKQYTHYCYSDVLALYGSEHLAEGKVPYFGWPVEYPVLTGYFMGALGLPVHAAGVANPGLNQYEVFFNLNAFVLAMFGLAAIAVTTVLRRRRPWDAAMLALAPILLVTAFVNWDLLVVGLTAFALFFWARERPVLAGVFLGLAAAAKFYPLFIAGPIIVLALRSARVRAAAITIGTGVATWVVVNAPVFFFARTGWNRFFDLNSTRGVDWGTLWYIGWKLPVGSDKNGGIQPFVYLASHIDTLNVVTWVLFALGCLGVAALALLAPRRPRLAQLAFIVVALFLLTSKVWSQQYVLWLLPLAVLARPRWGALLAWQIAELGYFLAFYGEENQITSGTFVFPETIFVIAALLRWVMVAVLVGFVVRDCLHPERDVVRHSYDDDPDGGAFDGAPDTGLELGRRWWGQLRGALPRTASSI